MTTIYYETCKDGLIACEFLGWAKSSTHDTTRLYDAVVKLKESKACYKAGEVIHTLSWHVVEKAGRKNYTQLVKNATLPPVDKDNLIPCRW